MASKTICNRCGREFDEWDEANHFNLYHKFGYGSSHDGDELSADLCCKCADGFVENFVAQCSINPLIEH